MVMAAAVEPVIATPLRRHWKLMGPLPVTPTAKVATLPSFTAMPAGCVTMVSGTGAVDATGLTVSTALPLVTLPALLLTCTA